MFVLWHQSTALMPMQFAPPHPFAKANARALQSFEKKNHKCPMVGKKQGVQIPCGHMVRKEADFALLGLSKNY